MVGRVVDTVPEVAERGPVYTLQAGWQDIVAVYLLVHVTNSFAYCSQFPRLVSLCQLPHDLKRLRSVSQVLRLPGLALNGRAPG